MVVGTSEGFSKDLQLIGVGYRGAVAGKTLTMNLGFSHPVVMEIPHDVEVKVTSCLATALKIDCCCTLLIHTLFLAHKNVVQQDLLCKNVLWHQCPLHLPFMQGSAIATVAPAFTTFGCSLSLL